MSIIYGPAPAAVYPVRPLAAAPVAEHTAYIIACQLADEARDAQYPHGGPALNHRPTDAELKTILLDALAASTLRAYQTLYQQYCNRSSIGKTYQDLYNDIRDLVKYERDGIKSSTAKDSDMDESDGSRSTKESSRSSNSHSSRRNQQIAAAANYLAQQQVAANTAANASIRYQEQSPGKQTSQSPSSGQGGQPPCKNCKSTKHTTKWCTSTKCHEPNCGKSFKDAAERKAHFMREHGFNRPDDKPSGGGKKSSFKKGQLKPGVKFSKVNRVKSEDGEADDDDSCIDSEVSSDSSMSVDRAPKSITWSQKKQSRKVSKIRTVSTIHRTTTVPGSPGSPPATDNVTGDDAPPLVEDSSEDSSEDYDAPYQGPPNPQMRARPVADGRIFASWRPMQGMRSMPDRILIEENRKQAADEAEPPVECMDVDSEDSDSEHEAAIPAPTRATRNDTKSVTGTKRKQTREPRTVQPCDSEDPPVKGPEPGSKCDSTRTSLSPDYSRTSALDSPPEPLDRNEGYPKYNIDEFWNSEDYTSMYVRYRIAGGKMKFKEDDTGRERYYEQWPGIELQDIGNWEDDYNNIAPCEWSMEIEDYQRWFLSVHPKPVDIREATRHWLDRRTQLHRRQHPAPGSYEEFLEIRAGTRNYPDGGVFDYIHAPEDTWDKGSLYRMHMIRRQAAIDMPRKLDAPVYITEQEIDDYLIENHLNDTEKMVEEDAARLAMQQKKEALLAKIRADKPNWKMRAEQAIEMLRNQDRLRDAIRGVHEGATRLHVNPAPVLDVPERSAKDPEPVHEIPEGPDWDFFYRSLTAEPDTRSAILTRMSSGTKPVLKSELRTQRTLTLSDRFTKKQRAIRTAIRKQRHVNAIVDTGAQVTTMPESAVSRMPMAHNHRDAPPGTAVKYGNGEIETIERLVDIGHYEVQITPDNCSTSLISVDQIVEDGHTVTFTRTQTVIADEVNRYSLAYPRVPNSREWTIPMHAMEDISQLRQENPQSRN